MINNLSYPRGIKLLGDNLHVFSDTGIKAGLFCTLVLNGVNWF